jgi:tetratricopeptide (TPR) repeat protein
MNTDTRELPLSTTSKSAADAYRAGVDLMLSAWPGAIDKLSEAIKADPDFALAHAALARLYAMRADPQSARDAIAKARAAVDQRGTDREKSHVATLELAVTGQAQRALETTLTHVATWPRDAIILSLPLGAFGLFAFSGMRDHDQARVDLCESVASHYADDDWWFLTYRGWSQTENGDVTRGLAFSERGFALRRANANGAHAVAHGLFETGAMDDAEKLMGAWLPTYDRAGVLHGHLSWHEALSALDRGDAPRAVKIYDTYIAPTVSPGAPINIVTDAISFLWRLDAYGYNAPKSLWDDAKAYADAKFPNAGQSFVDAHMGLLQAATGDIGAAEKRLDALAALVRDNRLAAGPVVPQLTTAALAFARGDFAACVQTLEPITSDIARIGGSGAQRQIFEDMLLLALMRLGDTPKARALLDQRLHRRPSRQDQSWQSALTT